MAQKRFQFTALARSFKRKSRLLPRQIGNIALKHFLQSFRKGGFTDKTFDAWKARKRPSLADRRNPKKRRGLLIQSGNLRKSLRVRSANFSQIAVGSYGIRYARIHNRGGRVRIPVTPKSRAFFRAMFKETGDPIFKNMALSPKETFIADIPKRQFIGDSFQMDKKIKNRIRKEIKAIFK